MTIPDPNAEQDRSNWKNRSGETVDLTLVGADHIRQYEETGGVIGHDWNHTSCLILHAIGRNTGRTIKKALIYAPYEDAFVIVGSLSGSPKHPNWYLNLVAHPDARVQVWDAIHDVRARTSTGTERERLWKLVCDEFPPYADYQQKTDREIPVVVLDRR